MHTLGNSILISHPNKILFPKAGITKRELIAYYEGAAPAILPYLKDRPLTLHRFPHGIAEDGFFQKNASLYFPDWIQTTKLPKKEGWVNHVICNTKEALIYLVNQDTITFHIALSKKDKPEYPDRLIIDLDPPNGSFNVVLEGLELLRVFFETCLSLPTYVMTTGSRGLHLIIPLKGREHFDEVHIFAKKIAQYVSESYPDKFTHHLRREQRKGRIFIDYLRNSYGQISVCPFSVRAIEGGPVAMPLSWEEVEKSVISNSQFYTMNTVLERLKKYNDPWETMEKHAISIKSAQMKLSSLMQP